MITSAHLQDHVETDLEPGVLKRLIDDAYAYIADRVGPQGEQTVVMPAGERYLMLPQPIASEDDVSISERFGDRTTVLVEGTDWRWLGGRRLERLSGGTVVFWGHEYGVGDVLVTYTPKDDTARRDRIVIDLCKLAIQYGALSSERAGDYGASHLDYAKEREKLVRQLAPVLGVA